MQSIGSAQDKSFRRRFKGNVRKRLKAVHDWNIELALFPVVWNKSSRKAVELALVGQPACDLQKNVSPSWTPVP
jgi:hypothetical protein